MMGSKHSDSGKTLPQGWTWTSLNDCVSIVDSRRIPINAEEREKRISGKPEASLYPYYGTTGQVGWIDGYIFDEEIVLLGEDGAPFLEPTKDKAYMVRGKSWVNNHAHVLIGMEGLVNSYLCHYLNVFDYHGYVTGTTRLKLNQSRMQQIPILIPPLPEQHRIVSKIEELFTKLDAGVDELKKAKAQLRRYRQVVLAHAFRGKLTKEWRDNQRKIQTAAALLGQIEEGRKRKSTGITTSLAENGLPQLPNGWLWARMESIASVIGGVTKNSKRQSYPLQLPYLRVANVYAGELRLDQVLTIGVSGGELERVLLQTGDLLVVEGNGSIDQIGRVALWDGSISPCIHQNHLIKVRFDLAAFGRYVLYWLLSSEGRNHITKVASSTSGLHTLSISKVEALPVPLCPLDEQEQIVQEIERHLSLIEKAEEIIDHELNQSHRLRHGILRHAFDGKLVPQDPADEPAEKLLNRIRGSASKTTQSKRKSKSNGDPPNGK